MKNTARALALSLLFFACSVLAAVGAWGDSITFGVAASPASAAYVPALSTQLGVPIANHAVSGHMAADQAIASHGVIHAAGDKDLVMIGTNDQWKYGTSTAKQAYYQGFLLNIVTQLAAPNRVRARDMAVTGSWWNSQPAWSMGLTTYNIGATASATVSGTAIYVSVLKQDDLSGVAVNGTADVLVDGVKVGSIGALGTGMTTGAGNTYAPFTYRFGGLSAGSHTVQVVCTSTSGISVASVFYLESIAGSAQTVKPTVFLSTILRYAPVGYSTFGGSDANMAIFNGIVAGAQAALIGDGLQVVLVDNSAAVNQSTDLNTDGVHPVNTGHAKIESTEYTAISGPPPPPPPPPTYSPAQIVIDAFGNFFGQKLDGTGTKQLTQ